MKKIASVLLILLFAIRVSSGQEIIKGVTNTVSLVKKSAKLPSIKNKDGSTIVLSYKEPDGLKVMMGKNGKNFPLCDPFPNALMVQVAEADIDNDGKLEILVGARTSAESVEIKIYKKPEFETLYKIWSSFTGVQSFEFPGDGTVKLYDMNGKSGLFKISAEGKLTEI
ncbi:MAG: VCBS repeat-containing protein [Chitinophagales bacterium]|nr:VCBS repeat-containing protein [Chitinophagales bacterium]